MFYCYLVPTAEQQSEAILISGPATKVEGARQALVARVTELEKDKEDRVLKNFTVEVLIPLEQPCYFLFCFFFFFFIL